MTAANEGRKPMIFEGTPFNNGEELSKYLDEQRQKETLKGHNESSNSVREVRSRKRSVQEART